MATEFVCTIKSSNGDYSSLNAWNVACDCDLTAATTKVFSHGGITGSISDGSSVTGKVSSATGIALHVTTTQILIKTISGTFQSGEQIYETDGVNYVTSSNTGDSAIAVAECYSFHDTTAVNLSGWTSSPDNYPIIRTPSDERHDGKWNTSKYYLDGDNASDGILKIDTDYAILEGLQVRNTAGSPSGNSSAIYVEGSSAADQFSQITIKECIFRGGRTCVRNAWGSKRYILCENVIAYGPSSSGSACFVNVGNGHGGPAMRLDHCTAIGGENGIYNYKGWMTCRNCYVYGSSLGFKLNTGTIEMVKCASSDTTGSTGLHNIAHNTDNFVNVTGGSEDYHLPVGSALIDVGEPLIVSDPHPHWDVGSVCDWHTNLVTYAVLELTNGSAVATIKFRNAETHAWIPNLEKTFNLQYSFTGTSTKIAITGDPHIGMGVSMPDLESMVNDIDDSLGDIDKVFMLGDLADTGTVAQFTDYKTERAKSDIFIANNSDWRELPGNHDSDVSIATYKTEMSYDPVYYSVLIGNVSFLFCGDETGSAEISSAQQTWLSGVLSSNEGNSHNSIILSHQGHYNGTKGTLMTAGSYGYLRPKATIQGYLDTYDWVAWFNSHSHGYTENPSPDELGYYKPKSSWIDIDGDARSSSTPAVGADEIAEASMLIIMQQMDQFNGGAIL